MTVFSLSLREECSGTLGPVHWLGLLGSGRPVSVLPESRRQGEATESPQRLPVEMRHKPCPALQTPRAFCIQRSAPVRCFREHHFAGKTKSSSFWSSACHPVWEPLAEPAPRPGADGLGAGGRPVLSSPSSVSRPHCPRTAAAHPSAAHETAVPGSLGSTPHGHGLVPLSLTVAICNMGLQSLMFWALATV